MKVLPTYLRSCTPMRLEKNPDAVRSRNRLKKATPAACSGFALAGQAMSSSTPVRSAAAQATKVLPYRSSHSRSSQASPPRTGVCRSGSSPSMKSMNSGTPASVALPERSSLGRIRPPSTRTVPHSCGVNCFGSYGTPRASASRARADASRTDSAAHGNPAASGAPAIRPTTSRRFMSAIPDLVCRDRIVAGAGSPSGSGRLTAAPPRPSRLRLRGSPSAPDVRRFSQRALSDLIGDVVAGPHRQRENRPRRLLGRLRHERPAVGDEQVLTVVCLAPAVRHGGLGVVPHARTAELVDDDPAGGDAVPLFGARHRREYLTAHLGDERPERLLHVLHLLVLVIRPLPMKPEHRDAPSIHHAWVDLAVAVVVGDHLAAAREADRGAVVAAGVVPQLLSVNAPGGGGGEAAPETPGGAPRAPPPPHGETPPGDRAPRVGVGRARGRGRKGRSA